MTSREGINLLLLVTLLLLVGGIAGSAIYWSTGGGEAFLATQEDYRHAIAAAAAPASLGSSQPDPVRQADQHWGRVAHKARIVETHAHLLFLCILLLLFVLLMCEFSMPETRSRLAWLGSGGVVLYPLGLIVQAAGATVYGQALSAIGAVALVVFAGIVTWGLLRSPRNAPGDGQSGGSVKRGEAT